MSKRTDELPPARDTFGDDEDVTRIMRRPSVLGSQAGHLQPLSPLRRAEVFGAFEWKAEPLVGTPDRIVIKDSWERDNLVRLEIPQLQGLALASPIRFHRRGVTQLLAFFIDVEAEGLLSRIRTWNGSFVPRFKRGRAAFGGLADLSNHAWGMAFDINAQWNRVGAPPAAIGQTGSVAELVPIAHRHGFVWGGSFVGRPEGAHFELAKVV
jgi:hypothetical protein